VIRTASAPSAKPAKKDRDLDADNVARVLDADTWHERRRRLDELGGPPP
jgi:hypothetical protein